MKPKGSRNDKADVELSNALAEFYDDPLGYVMFSFPWDSETSIQLVRLQSPYKERFNCEFGPDLWACEFLDQLGAEIKKRKFDGRVAVDPIQFATASGHGIGKSVLTSWLIKFIMDTRPLSKGVVTAGTADQLRTKTWAELGKWHKLSLTEHWFTYNSSRGNMSLVHKQFPEQWRCDAQTCKEENSESFAGLHAANATPFFIFDEASGVPDKIFEVRDGGLTDGEPMVFDFGNPTKNSGRFFDECVGRLRKRFIVRNIDSRTVSITNKELHKRWIEDNGIDSDFVKVRILGQFPSAGSLQFIPTEDVRKAQYREAVLDRTAPLLIGVDVARFGDDESVIYPRIGNDARSFPPKRFRELDTVQLTGKVIEMIRDFEKLGKRVAGLFVDGTGLGGGVVDQLRHSGYPVHEVQFGSSPIDTSTYRYRSDEIWGRMREGIKNRLALPNNGEIAENLQDQLTMREFGYTQSGQKIHLETKDDLRKRVGKSPDLADALALTFALDVVASESSAEAPRFTNFDYDPLSAKW